MWGTNLSVPLSIVALVSRYLTNKLMERMPIYYRFIFNKYIHADPLYYRVLVRLSTGYPLVVGRLHTRYSPVRRSPPNIAICAAPRLACVRPVASVHPEPGSNSSLYVVFMSSNLPFPTVHQTFFSLLQRVNPLKLGSFLSRLCFFFLFVVPLFYY